jgi:hypothetical protein
MQNRASRTDQQRPHDRFELLAYVVDFARELLKDTAMSLRLYGLLLVLALSIGLLFRVVTMLTLLLRWHTALAAGTPAAIVVVPVASWFIQRIKRALSSRRGRR